ncbi:unnamed protein product [Allacma fusca]|uniref:Glucose-methanol-choline oxidoreductase N-terminal domain-containing protein n=1 Tax=Allacma fusca TaxID=39272 RepID=A0A8J2P834_9HEXA|nr:unnamed protein product [Allacma fusca]
MPPQIQAYQQIQQSFNSLHQWFPLVMFGFIGALSTFVTTWHDIDAVSDRVRASLSDTEDTFDFIVVGSGSAGAVVANRLSVDYNVLLLEAGGEPNPFNVIPALSFLMLSHPEIDWLHKTVPQKKACYALPNQQAGWSAGKALGGTSNTNFLIYLRGHPKDFDVWANITGDPSWSYDGVLPHFKSIESYEGEFDNDEYHGHSGNMRISTPPYLGMAEMFIEAGQELGYPRADLNGRFETGFSPIFYPIRNGRRDSGFKAFIEPARLNQKLTIYKFSTVSRVLFNGRNEAIGVEYVRHGIPKKAFAHKEVILSGGSMGSPKILMLSGIGPREHLESLGIPVRVDLPVGKNLQDHISSYLGPFFVDREMTVLMDRDVNAKAFVDFTQRGEGVLTTSGCQASAFVASTKAIQDGEGNWPDLQFILLGNGVYSKMAPDFARAFHLKPELLKSYLKHAEGKDSFHIIVSVARPKARGDIRLSSADPSAPLLIDPHYLENDHDIQVFVDGIKRAVYLVENTTTFNEVNGRFTDVPFPLCANFPFRSDAYWECYARSYTITLHHIVGPCSMGRKDSKEAVVDPELKVLGVQRLRVVDASVMPRVVVSNTHASAAMVGEKGAQMILNTWRNAYQSDYNDIIR